MEGSRVWLFNSAGAITYSASISDRVINDHPFLSSLIGDFAFLSFSNCQMVQLCAHPVAYLVPCMLWTRATVPKFVFDTGLNILKCF